MRKMLPVQFLLLVSMTTGCAPETARRLDLSAQRAGIEAAVEAVADGDCRLMEIRSHFQVVPGAPEGELERRNAGLAAVRLYNGPHLLNLETPEDEELNRLGLVYAKAYNDHIVSQRGRPDCDSRGPGGDGA
jgi:hypothetical protein